MKVQRYGQAAILWQSDIDRLFSEGFQTVRDRALFGVCLYTACRIKEACSMPLVDAFTGRANVRSPVILRKCNTKGKRATRSIPPHWELVKLLTDYQQHRLWDESPYLFPGRWGYNFIHPSSADAILRSACERVGLQGVSTHSFRRTTLTAMHRAGVPLRVIQEISGHESLAALERYLEVSEEQIRGAIASLQFEKNALFVSSLMEGIDPSQISGWVDGSAVSR